MVGRKKSVLWSITGLGIVVLAIGVVGLWASNWWEEYQREEAARQAYQQELARKEAARKAVISSAVAYAAPEGASKVFLNKIEGKIVKEEKFSNFPDWIAPTSENSFGGGYNAIFLPHGWDRTLAEISPIEAIPWSYREKNFIDVIKYILNQD